MNAIAPNTLIADRYTLVEAVPDRGLGETWRARDGQRDGATVQVKFLRAIGGDDVPPDALRVIRALRALRNPVIPSVVNQGVHAGRPWIAFDDILGDSFGTRLDRGRSRGEPLDLALIRKVFDGVAAALTAAHTAPVPVLHGSLTPGSVIVLARPVRGASGALLDLGLAPWLDAPTDLAARSARSLIAPAPELARAGQPTVATDVFSLGALLTELLATPAGLGETMMAVSVARRRPDAPPGVWGVLERSMALRPEERFPSIHELAFAVGRAWSEAPAPGRLSGLPEGLAGAPSGRSSLLDTFSSEAAPRAPVATPAAAPEAPVVPLLGAMPALSPAAGPAQPLGWENPWSTLALQAKVTVPAFEPPDRVAPRVEPGRGGPPAAPDLGATHTMDVASMPWARALDPSMALASPDATLLAAPARRAASLPAGTLIAASASELQRLEAPAMASAPGGPPAWTAPTTAPAPMPPPALVTSPPTSAKLRRVLLGIAYATLLLLVAAAAYRAGR